MCSFQGILGGLSAVMGYGAQVQAYKAQGEAAKANAENAIWAMNKEFQNYEIERQDAFDAAVQKIMSIRANAAESNATVEAAVNEQMEGRTAQMLSRKGKVAESQNVSQVQENFQRKSNEIDLNKETALNSTKRYVANIKAPEKPSALAAIVGVASGVVAGNSQAKADKLRDLEYDYWEGRQVK